MEPRGERDKAGVGERHKQRRERETEQVRGRKESKIKEKDGAIPD